MQTHTAAPLSLLGSIPLGQHPPFFDQIISLIQLFLALIWKKPWLFLLTRAIQDHSLPPLTYVNINNIVLCSRHMDFPLVTGPHLVCLAWIRAAVK